MGKKLLIVLVLMVCGIAGVWADEIDEEQALKEAKAFLGNRQPSFRKGGTIMTSDTELKLQDKVSGLYVFNATDGSGFIIVSNDDSTVPILGFSDNGALDTNNIPDNMRAWLQGYADEIAWFQKHGGGEMPATKARKRTGSHQTKTIDPLLTTTWDQDAPYNNHCPKNYVTGCVATAMAQVMYYTETVTHNNATTATTAEIPGYTTRKGDNTLDLIPAGTPINWSNITPTYDKNSTDAQKEAVANLMLYCGCAVMMNYGPSSGAFTYDVDDALRDYFGYDATTRYVSRNWYYYDDWIDLIYHELSNRRPVIYAGQSTGGGHEFVCDGYKYEDGKDLFHINWGWSGTSDGYFLLSALDPDQQGIGGSSSNDGYHYGQEAVIGIQKDGDGGTVLNTVVAHVPNITIKNITLSHPTIALGESVTVTVSVTNNSEQYAYDGEITLNGIKGGKVFVIPAGATQDCEIIATPTTTFNNKNVKAEYTKYEGKTNPNTGQSIVSVSEISTCSAQLTVKNQTPTDLTATNVSPATATIGWTNAGNASKWNLRYQPVSVTTEDFSGTADEWILDGWERASSTVQTMNNDNLHWLVSPKITFGGFSSFYAWKSSGTTEYFSVLYSRDGQYFTYILYNVEATTTQTKYTVDLSNYSGKGWIAIIHSGNTEGSNLYVDDITIAEPGDEWIKVNNLTTNSHNLTGLPTTAPRYEVQVQAVNNNGGNWSNPFILATANSGNLVLANDDTNANLISLWNGVTANVTLNNRILYKDGGWNTLTLPFDVDLTAEECPLAGAEARELVSASITNSTLNLTFNDATNSPVTTLVAGTPYIIKWNTVTTNIENPVFNNVTINKTKRNKVCKIDDKKAIAFKGTYEKMSYTSEDKSILFLGGGNTLNYPESGASIGAQRAYFQLKGIRAAELPDGARSIVLNFGGKKTGILEVKNSRIEELESGAWYSLDGRRLEGKPNKKGIYLNHGHKVIIK